MQDPYTSAQIQLFPVCYYMPTPVRNLGTFSKLLGKSENDNQCEKYWETDTCRTASLKPCMADSSSDIMTLGLKILPIAKIKMVSLNKLHE